MASSRERKGRDGERGRAHIAGGAMGVRSRREGLVQAAIVLGLLRSVRVREKEVGRRKEKGEEKKGRK
jgi:hypothetical protein